MYLLNEDYHRTGTAVTQRLQEALATWNHGMDFRYEAQTDAGPALEKVLALFGHLGDLGRNTLLRTSEAGCIVHLAVAFTSLELPRWRPSPPRLPDCAACGACVRNCPSGCLEVPVPDYRRCRSYLSMEKSGALSADEQRLLGDCLLGCSFCTASCPSGRHRPEVIDAFVDAEDLLRMPSNHLRRLLAGTAADHAGVTRLKRNAAAILGTSLPLQERQARQAEFLALSESEAVRQTILNWAVQANQDN